MFENITTRLARIRKEKQIKQGVLAKRIGISQMTLSYCERGHRSPHPVTLEAWANALGYQLRVQLVPERTL